jgi:hypothetical protein
MYEPTNGDTHPHIRRALSIWQKQKGQELPGSRLGRTQVESIELKSSRGRLKRAERRQRAEAGTSFALSSRYKEGVETFIQPLQSRPFIRKGRQRTAPLHQSSEQVNLSPQLPSPQLVCFPRLIDHITHPHTPLTRAVKHWARPVVAAPHSTHAALRRTRSRPAAAGFSPAFFGFPPLHATSHYAELEDLNQSLRLWVRSEPKLLCPNLALSPCALIGGVDAGTRCTRQRVGLRNVGPAPGPQGPPHTPVPVYMLHAAEGGKSWGRDETPARRSPRLNTAPAAHAPLLRAFSCLFRLPLYATSQYTSLRTLNYTENSAHCGSGCTQSRSSLPESCAFPVRTDWGCRRQYPLHQAAGWCEECWSSSRAPGTSSHQGRYVACSAGKYVLRSRHHASQVSIGARRVATFTLGAPRE